ncbi:gfo/Idh/MocA family oxidoreductase [Paenibacillus sambharensis]|uniref:Gfo/Idh/MocA family oxidoreductase n=2 Tax=Paenibacillus sambharensis TaxID=1803190 RepID=A0A2W1LRS8_9BACL|nr:gfo/Idh/MocA family oxidoreductase [Paenibacillus sambharensis]
MANVWVEDLLERPEVKIAALVDIQEANAKALADRHGLTCGLYTGLEEAIRQSGADLVVDATIPASHYAVSSTAMRLGCHVFSEKPMAATMQEAQDIVRIAEETGRSMAVMQNRRFNRHIRALRGLIADGTIGRIGYTGADFFLAPHFGGFRDAMESPLILDMAIHTFDQARYITGADPVSVYCQEFNPAGSWYAGNAAAICIFEMSDGSIFCYRGSWCAEGVPTSWDADWRINGEKGTAVWDGEHAPYAEVVDPDEQEEVFLKKYTRVEASKPQTEREGHTGGLDEMFAALREGRAAETDCKDNIKSMAMVMGALESARSGCKVTLAEYLAEN